MRITTPYTHALSLSHTHTHAHRHFRQLSAEQVPALTAISANELAAAPVVLKEELRAQLGVMGDEDAFTRSLRVYAVFGACWGWC